VDAALGWVVRKATTNVLRHSGDRSVAVGLVEDGVRPELTVTDDGTGDRMTLLGLAPGAGLAGLRERVAAVGGELDAGPVDGGGYRVRASVPLVRESAVRGPCASTCRRRSARPAPAPGSRRPGWRRRKAGSSRSVAA
jgi:two-component system sensor histidine kinase DesK